MENLELCTFLTYTLGLPSFSVLAIIMVNLTDHSYGLFHLYNSFQVIKG